MKSGRIARAWLSYRCRVLPVDCPPIQEVECRRAFYAGAQAFFGEIQRILEPCSETTEAEVGVLEEMRQELLAYCKAVEAGTA